MHPSNRYPTETQPITDTGFDYHIHRANEQHAATRQKLMDLIRDQGLALRWQVNRMAEDDPRRAERLAYIDRLRALYDSYFAMPQTAYPHCGETRRWDWGSRWG